MTDIIADAKQLLDGATPAPWVTGGKDESGNIYVGNPSGEGNLVATAGSADADLIAAAPELAQALSKEYWMFAVQVFIGKRWIYLGRGHSFNSLEEHACWFTSVDKARAFLAAGYKSNASKYPMKLVRQRRSPVEDWTANVA